MKGTMRECPIVVWDGCYSLSWQGLIVGEAFAHPAKYAHGLIRRIIEHGLERGWWTVGSYIGDPFGGVALGGIVAGYYGLNWVGVELESAATGGSPFVELGNRNIDLHRAKWKALGYDVNVQLVQGDSREFATILRRLAIIDQLEQAKGSPEQISAAITSPPYISGGHHPDQTGAWNTNGRGQGMTQDEANYGSTPGQIGRLKAGELSSVITSPPYAESIGNENGIDYSKAKGPKDGLKPSVARDSIGGPYGSTEGNIGNCRLGSLEGVLPCHNTTQITTDGAAAAKSGEALDGSPSDGKPSNEMGTPVVIVEQRTSSSSTTSKNQPKRVGNGTIASTTSKLSVADAISDSTFLAVGTSELVLSAANSLSPDKGPHLHARPTVGMSARGNSNLRAGQVDACITSPPYAESETASACKAQNPDGRQQSYKRAMGCNNYGHTEGQIGALRAGQVDACVTSPPYEATDLNGKRATPCLERKAELLEAAGHDAKKWLGKKRCTQMRTDGYGASDGQIGNSTGQTYWEACAQVYQQVYQSLRPGGVMAVVVKDYVAKGKRVPLCDDTLKLLVSIGFEPIERVHAMLVKETVENTLFDGPVTQRREKKSFFRRLAERRGSPRIDFEEVLWVRKPA